MGNACPVRRDRDDAAKRTIEISGDFEPHHRRVDVGATPRGSEPANKPANDGGRRDGEEPYRPPRPFSALGCLDVGGSHRRKPVEIVTDVGTCIADVLQSFLAGLLETPSEQPSQKRRGLGRQVRPFRMASQHIGQDVTDPTTAKCSLSRQHLEQHTPERPDVGPSIDRFPSRLLGGHVGGSAHHDAGRGHRRGHGRRRRGIVDEFRSQRLRQSEVEHLHHAVVANFDIGWFQIAMDDPLLMRRFQRLSDLFGNGQCLINRDRPLLDAISQRRPFDQLEDQRPLTLGFFQPVDVADVGMVQRGQDLGFTFEPGEAVWIIREGLGQDFQCHVPIELRISRSIHLTHAAFADLGGNFVRAEPGADLKGHRL